MRDRAAHPNSQRSLDPGRAQVDVQQAVQVEIRGDGQFPVRFQSSGHAPQIPERDATVAGDERCIEFRKPRRRTAAGRPRRRLAA